MITIKTEEARAVTAAALISNANNECSRRIFEAYPAQRQMNTVIAAAGNPEDQAIRAEVIEMEAFIRSYKDKYYALKQLIEAATLDEMKKIDVTLNEHWS